YLMREWVRRDPSTIADRFALGRQRAEVAGVIAGVVEPPRPTAVARLADAVPPGLHEGDPRVARDRAPAFFRALATRSALDAARLDDDDVATRLTRRAGALLRTAEELEDAAELWRAGRLD